MLIGCTIEFCFKLRQLSAIVYNYKCGNQASIHLFFLFMFRTGFMLYVKRSHLRDAPWLPCQTSVKYTCFLRYIPYTLFEYLLGQRSWPVLVISSCLIHKCQVRLDTSFKILLKNFLVAFVLTCNWKREMRCSQPIKNYVAFYSTVVYSIWSTPEK